MSITQQLQAILQARYGRDVRQAIHDSIEDGYNIAVQAEGKATTAQDSASASASAAAQSSTIALQSAQLAEQYKNEAFSGTPTGYEDLVNKVNSIYRETTSDFASIGTSEGSALAHTIYGMSVQDGTPTPDSPVEIQSAKANFRCTGKNLIPYPYSDGTSKTSNGITYTVNSDGSVTANGTATGESTFNLRQGGTPLNSTNNIKVHTDKNLVLSGCPSGGLPNNYGIQIALTNGTNIWASAWEDRGEGKTFSFIPSIGYYNISIIRIIIASGVTANNLTFKPMLTLEDADQTYEPYQHTDVTTDLTLRAIEVASTDDYTYERDGKYYIADTVDWSEDEGYQITRRVKEITIDENNTSDWYEASTAVYDQITYSLDTITSNITLMCNQMPNAVSWTPNNCFVRSSNHLAHFLFDANKFGSKENAIAYFTNNPLVFTYVKDTPTTEPITSEQAQALLSLKTYDEATSISATGDIEPSLNLEYSKDRNTALALTGHNLGFKNALKLNDINTALIELGGN